AQLDAPVGFAGGAIVEIGLADRAVLQRLQRVLGGGGDRLLPFQQQHPKIVQLLRRRVLFVFGRRVIGVQRTLRLGEDVDIVTGNRRHAPTPPSEPARDRPFPVQRRLCRPPP